MSLVATRPPCGDSALALVKLEAGKRLAAEAVERAALALERVDDVHGGDRLPAGVLGVGDRVTDHVLEEHLEDPAGLLVDEARDALDATTAGEAADGRLRDPLDGVAQNDARQVHVGFSAVFDPAVTDIPVVLAENAPFAGSSFARHGGEGGVAVQ